MKIEFNNGTFRMIDGDIIVELTPNQDNYLKLPDNSCNRVWVSCAKVLKQPNHILDYGDQVKEPRKLNTTNHTPRKSIMEWMSEEDRTTVEALIEKAKLARAEATKKVPKSELERKLERLAKLQAEVDRLTKDAE